MFGIMDAFVQLARWIDLCLRVAVVQCAAAGLEVAARDRLCNCRVALVFGHEGRTVEAISAQAVCPHGIAHAFVIPVDKLIEVPTGNAAAFVKGLADALLDAIYDEHKHMCGAAKDVAAKDVVN